MSEDCYICGNHKWIESNCGRGVRPCKCNKSFTDHLDEEIVSGVTYPVLSVDPGSPEGDYSPEVDLSGRADKIFPDPVTFDPYGDELQKTHEALKEVMKSLPDVTINSLEDLYGIRKPKRKRHILKRYKRSRYR
jgi:hypothetical protein